MSVLGLSMPVNGIPSQKAGGTLDSLLADPLEFDAPVHGQPLNLHSGVRTIPYGPPSPLPRSQGYANLHDQAGPSTYRSHSHSPEASTSKVSSSQPVTPPSRKGKEPASANSTHPSIPSASKTPLANGHGETGKYLYPAISDLSWPKQFATIKRPGAGLNNPSMACYVNATLQVVLHTPPALRMISEHIKDGRDEPCACG